jgi:hypothetical protein
MTKGPRECSLLIAQCSPKSNKLLLLPSKAVGLDVHFLNARHLPYAHCTLGLNSEGPLRFVDYMSHEDVLIHILE